jgi:hypothetical protein
MCDDLKAEIVALGEKGVRVTDPQEARWGSIAKVRLPGGGEVGLYQPKASNGIGPDLTLTHQLGTVDAEADVEGATGRV